jgi:hypothetical protein
MLQNSRKYDESLEAFSVPSLDLIEYDLDQQGQLTVHGQTKDLYRYIDCTVMAEALFAFVQTTIEKELPAEIQFLRQYDQARSLIREVVELPNRHADLLIRLIRQNGGHLSQRNRGIPDFAKLTPQEIHELESAIRQAFMQQ